MNKRYPDFMSMPMLANWVLILLISFSKSFNFALNTSSVMRAPTFKTIFAPESARENTLNIIAKKEKKIKRVKR